MVSPGQVGSYDLTIETVGRTLGVDETNDILAEAIDTGLNLTNSGIFNYSGEIGDNTNLLPENDVDLFKLELDIGEQVKFSENIDLLDENGNPIPSGRVQLFDANGLFLSTEQDPESPDFDDRIYRAENEPETLYIGVSGFGTFYDPSTDTVGSDGFPWEVGSYDLTIETVGRTLGVDETNDILAEAIDTGLNLTNSGIFNYSGEIGDNTNLLPENDVDLFKLELDIGEQVKFSENIDLLDENGNPIPSGRVQLFDANGLFLSTEQDPESPDFDDRIYRAENEPETLYIGVSGFGTFYDPSTDTVGSDGFPWEVGSYDLTIETVGRTLGVDETNDILAEAIDTGLNLTNSGIFNYSGEIGDNTNLLPENDVDLFKLELDIGEQVKFSENIDLLDENGNPIPSGRVQLFDANGLFLSTEQDPESPDFDDRIYRAENEPETLYIGVSGFGTFYDPSTDTVGSDGFPWEVGSYDLTIETVGRTLGVDETNDILAEAIDTGLNLTNSGIFNYSGEIGDNTNLLPENDVDLFKLELDIGEQVKFSENIDLLDENGNPIPSGRVQLFDANGLFLSTEQDPESPDFDDRIYRAENEPETLYIGVSGFGTFYDPSTDTVGSDGFPWEVGSYDLTIETVGRTLGVDETNDILAEAIDTGLNLTNSGIFNYSGEIGDNTNLLPENDVDLFKLELDIGEQVKFSENIDLLDENGNPIPSGRVQLFDANGLFLSTEQDPESPDFDDRIYRAENEPETLYIGVSGFGTFYDPSTDTVGSDGFPWEVGSYDLTIETVGRTLGVDETNDILAEAIDTGLNLTNSGIFNYSGEIGDNTNLLPENDVDLFKLELDIGEQVKFSENIDLLDENGNPIPSGRVQLFDANGLFLSTEQDPESPDFDDRIYRAENEPETLYIGVSGFGTFYDPSTDTVGSDGFPWEVGSYDLTIETVGRTLGVDETNDILAEAIDTGLNLTNSGIFNYSGEIGDNTNLLPENDVDLFKLELDIGEQVKFSENIDLLDENGNPIPSGRVQLFDANGLFLSTEQDPESPDFDDRIYRAENEPETLYIGVSGFGTFYDPSTDTVGSDGFPWEVGSYDLTIETVGRTLGVDETNDILAEAIDTGLNLTNSGIFNYSGEIGDNTNLLPENDVDLFKLELDIGEQVKFSENIDLLDENGNPIPSGRVQLFDANGLFLSTEQDPESPDFDDRIYRAENEPETLYIGVSGFGTFYDPSTDTVGSDGFPWEVGSYDLTIETVGRTLGVDETNDILAEAIDTGLNLTNSGIFNYSGEIGDNTNLLPENDVDLFKLELDIGEQVKFSENIDLLDENGFPIAPGRVQLFNADGMTLFGESDPDGSSFDRIYRAEFEPETLYIGVSGINTFYDPSTDTVGNGGFSNEVGTYNLTIETVDRTLGADETNDILAEAIDTGLNLTNSGVFNYSGEIGDNTNLLPENDVDLFKFELDIGEQVKFSEEIELLDENGNPIAPGRVQLFNADGMTLFGESDPDGSIFDRIYRAEFEPETLYIGVSGSMTSYDPSTDTVGDGGMVDQVGSYDLTIETNDPPTLDLDGNDSSGATGNDYTTTFIEGGNAVAIGDNGDVVITDVDDTNIESATITLTNRPDGDTVESLSVNSTLPTGITASSYDSATGTITLTGSATLADYQTAIAQIEYNNSSTNPNTNARSVTVVVNDGDSDSNTATTTINIIATNSAPVVNSNAITVDEASQNTGLGLTAPTDADGDPLTITVTGLPTLGQVTKADGTVVNNGDTLTSEELQGLLYDAPADYDGTKDPGDFTYNVGDGTTNVSGSTDITITTVNEPPVAENDSASTNRGEAVTFSITSNDSDTDDTLDLTTVDLDPSTPERDTSITVPGEGGYTVDDAGNVTFTPEAGFTGVTTPITYTIQDNLGAVSNEANISIEVTEIGNLENDSTSTPPNTPVTFSISDNDENVDPSTIDLDTETPGIQKNITVPGEGTFAVDDDGNVTFTPLAGFEGEASIPYTANDNQGNPLEPADITVTVAPIPELTDDTANTPPNTPVTFSISDNDENVDPSTIDLDTETPGIQKNITVPGEGTFAVDDDGNVTFTPLAGFEGEASIPYTANDNQGNPLEPADITVTVAPIPELTDDTANTPPNTPVTFSISDNDENVDPSTIDLDTETPGIQKNITVPGEGTFAVDDDGNVTFTPLAGFEGEASIPYTANDNQGNPLEPADITVTVAPIPELTDDTANTPPNTPVTFSISDNDENVDPSTIDLDTETPGIQKNITVPGEGTFAVDDDGNVTFTPLAGFEGEASIPYTADDTEGNSLEPADITVTVEPVPELTDDTANTAPNTPVTFSIIENDENVDPSTIDLDPETPGIQNNYHSPRRRNICRR
ncbi:hypothetical protein CYANOKiyG1_67410 [Okeania sp. KiyG1]|nr:hypothetical protein CYANOKiyG1_67410 [Okeania sp. KiyG1]